MKKTLIAVLSLAAISLSGVNGQVIASFEESGAGGDLSGAFPINFITDSITGITLTADSNLQTATLAAGPGATIGTSGGSLGFSSLTVATLNDAITGNVYQSFTLTPSAGYQLNISGVTFNADASNTSSTFNFDLLSSVTGFTSSDSLGTVSVINGAAASTTIDTSAVTGLQGVTSSFEFRIYASRSAGSGTAAYYADDGVNSGLFAINGSVTAVPEPTTWALIGLGTAFVLWRIRRKKAARS
jgi:hypothetical protein